MECDFIEVRVGARVVTVKAPVVNDFLSRGLLGRFNIGGVSMISFNAGSHWPIWDYLEFLEAVTETRKPEDVFSRRAPERSAKKTESLTLEEISLGDIRNNEEILVRCRDGNFRIFKASADETKPVGSEENISFERQGVPDGHKLSPEDFLGPGYRRKFFRLYDH